MVFYITFVTVNKSKKKTTTNNMFVRLLVLCDFLSAAL